MTPPRDPGQGQDAKATGTPPAVSLCAEDAGPTRIETLRKRPDFLRAASARRQGTGSFLLQARFRDDGSSVARLGFTASKKIGNAVARNRAKRRMRAVAQAVLAPKACPGWDYVLVAKPQATIDRAYADLCADLARALQAVHK